MTLFQLDFLPEVFGKSIEHLIIKDNPVCGPSQLSLVRSYAIALLPGLARFNEEDVSQEETFSIVSEPNRCLSPTGSTRGQKSGAMMPRIVEAVPVSVEARR